jgi:hypothetical protein
MVDGWDAPPPLKSPLVQEGTRIKGAHRQSEPACVFWSGRVNLPSATALPRDRPPLDKGGLQGG